MSQYQKLLNRIVNKVKISLGDLTLTPMNTSNIFKITSRWLS